MVSTLMVTGFFLILLCILMLTFLAGMQHNYFFHWSLHMCINADKCKYIHMCLYAHTHTRPGGPAYVCTNSIWILKTSINFNFQGWSMTISQQRNYLSCNSRHQGPSALFSELLGFHTTFLLQKKRKENSKTERHKETRSYCRRHRQHSKTEKTLSRRLCGDGWARAMCCFLKDTNPNIKGLKKH